MNEDRGKLFMVRLDAAYYRLHHSLKRSLATFLALCFFAIAVAIVFLALFYSDDLVQAVGDCIGYKDGWTRVPCPQALQHLLFRVQSGEPLDFFNL